MTNKQPDDGVSEAMERLRFRFRAAAMLIERDVRLLDLTDDEERALILAVTQLPKHDFWGAGEPDCPREIKAGNGELHTLRCKVCGEDNPRDDRCFVARTPPEAEPSEAQFKVAMEAFGETELAAPDYLERAMRRALAAALRTAPPVDALVEADWRRRENPDADDRNVVEMLRSALERLDRNFDLLLRGAPVRDVAETKAEVTAALANSPTDEGNK